MEVRDEAIHTEYIRRLNSVFDFIDNNLGSDLSLGVVSEVACFSPFHFHRIFKLMLGETLNVYVARRRIEKSVLDLLHKNVSTTEIAHTYGFSDNSSYSRAFKKYYGVSPILFKKQNPNRLSKIRQLESKNGQVYPDRAKYICVINNLKKWIKMNAKIQIQDVPNMDLAYVSCNGPAGLENAYDKLIRWATPQGLMNEHTKMVTIYHDSFKVTEARKVRMSAAILLRKPVKLYGEVGLTSITKGTFIVGCFEIGLDEFEKSWTGLFLWMNENGYKKTAANPFEVYHNNFNEHPEKKAIVDFYIPIEL
ncbi:AraC family transcriptional regulator [Zhouia amylolytica]|uniref:AraC family transcriptional regulator n=1 Tax=Zhouia amylolytica TaxID=376730 RepID=UPI0020CD0643|nr:GyrI-like domain-containing protein [Zhouia amylolytica]MCQ0110121.1 AraC family transcriptional regulator [Zhouia amylolytica]